MSATKRARRPAAESTATVRSHSQPASKRLKSSHVPVRSGLDFLVDEDARTKKRLEAKLTNGVPHSQSSRVDDSRAHVARNGASTIDDGPEDDDANSNQLEIISLSSAEEESSELEEEEEEDEDDTADQAALSRGSRQSTDKVMANSHLSDDESIEDDDVAVGHQVRADEGSNADQDSEEGAEQTFGELMSLQHPEPVDLQKSLQNADPQSKGLVPFPGQQSIPAGHSLGTMLSQALKTNDKDMLETCLALNDQTQIRATIQRQTTREVATLLERIAERVHRRPGRAGSLMTWVQWSLVCHGGYIAHQPELMKKLRSLAHVLRLRADGLQPLLHLKGKLDILAAQLELRRGMHEASQAMNLDNQDDEQDVLYIEGRDDDDRSEDDETVNQEAASTARLHRGRIGKSSLGSDDEDGEEEDGFDNTPNGFPHDEDVESSLDEDEEDDEDDEEANTLSATRGLHHYTNEDAGGDEEENDDEESSNEESESNNSSEDDESSAEEDSETETVKQAKPNTLNRKR